MITIALTGWGAIFTANKRMEELGKRFDDAQASWNRRFDEVMAILHRIENRRS